MEKEKAIEIFNRQINCYKTDREECVLLASCSHCKHNVTPEELTEAMQMAISALEKQGQDRWRPCNEKPEYDFQNVLVRWHDKRKGCEKDYYIFEGYVVRGIWCGMFEDADISDFEPIEWKPLEPYTEDEA